MVASDVRVPGEFGIGALFARLSLGDCARPLCKVIEEIADLDWTEISDRRAGRKTNDAVLMLLRTISPRETGACFYVMLNSLNVTLHSRLDCREYCLEAFEMR